MNVALPAFAALVAALLMLALATKWKLPRHLALISIVTLAVLTAVPFAHAYTNYESEIGRGVVALVQVFATLAFGLLLLLVRFSRDPERVPPQTDRVVLSAADGEVAYVWKIAKDSPIEVNKGGRTFRLDELTGICLTTDAVHVVGVGMTFLDVHVNRCPIPGRVRLTKHIAGQFMSLGRDEAPFVNERVTTVIEGGSLNIAVVQIASRLVRRIQSYLEVGQTVSAGQRLGMIRFGSLVAIIIPDREDIRIEVAPGDYVKAGISVLARFE